MKLRYDIKGFKWREGKQIHETWIRFKKLLRKCLTHGLPSDLLFQYFYRSLDLINKEVVDKLIWVSTMWQPLKVDTFYLNDLTK